MENSKRKILDIESTISDLIIIIYTYFVVSSQSSAISKLIDVPEAGVILILLYHFFIPYFISRIFSKYEIELKKTWITISVIIVILTWSFSFEFVEKDILKNVKTVFGLSKITIQIVLLLGTIWISVVGVRLPFVKEEYKEGIKIYKDYNLSMKYLNISSIFFVNNFIFAFAFFFKVLSLNFFVTLLIIILYILITTPLIIAIFVFIQRWMDKFNTAVSSSNVVKSIQKAFFAILISALLCFWFELTRRIPTMKKSWAVLVIYSLSGYIPIRVLFELIPPFTPINLLTGLASISYLIYTLIGNL